MKIMIITVLILISPASFANDCSISIYNFSSSDQRIEEILVQKGYTIQKSYSRYKIQSEQYMNYLDQLFKKITFFENEVPVLEMKKRILWINAFTGGFNRAEKKLIAQLPDCRK